MQSMKIAIYNGQIVLENGILWDGVILIEDGKITSFGSRRELEIPSDFLRHDETILGTPYYVMDLQTLLDSIHTIRAAMKTSPSMKGIYMEGPYIL